MDFEAQKKDVDYTVDQGTMATADGHYRYGISTAIEQNWPGGIEAGFRPNDGHHECYWRTVIQMQRTRLREERYTVDPTLGELDGKGS